MPTTLAAAAEALAVRVSPPALVAHCRRTYAFGAALLEQQGRTFDADLLYIAAMLHDLGLTDEFEDGVTPFEQISADAARRALLAEGATPQTAELVHDAIARHLSPDAADDPRPEVAGVSLGAAVDVLGLRASDLPPMVVAEILETYPRLDFKTMLTDAIVRQVRLKPQSRIARYVEQYDFTALVAAAPFET
jgi:HD domain-containing protein